MRAAIAMAVLILAAAVIKAQDKKWNGTTIPVVPTFEGTPVHEIKCSYNGVGAYDPILECRINSDGVLTLQIFTPQKQKE